MGSAGSRGHSAPWPQRSGAASELQEHQVFLQSIHGTHSCFPFSFAPPPGIQVSLPFFKAELPMSISPLTWDHLQSSSLLNIFLFLGPLKQAYVLHISVCITYWGDKKKCEKVHKRKQIRFFESHWNIFLVLDPIKYSSQRMCKAKYEFKVKKNKSYWKNYPYIKKTYI